MLQHLREVSAINPPTTCWAADEMPGLVRGRIANAPADVFAAGDHVFGGSLWTSSSHSLSTTARISSEMMEITSISVEIFMQAPQVGRLHEFAIDDVALRGFSHRSQSSLSRPARRLGGVWC